MNAHKESIAVAYVARNHDAPVSYRGTIGTRQADIDQLIRLLHSMATHLVFVYEASPCGSLLYRYLSKKGDVCWVVAPLLTPEKAGDWVQTDRRDAVPWARFMRSGDRTPVDVRTVEDEAIRELCRAREEAIADLEAAQFRLKAFWLRHDLRSTGRATWSPAYLPWRSEVVCPTPAQHMVFQDYVRALTEHTQRLQRLEQKLQAQVASWRLTPVVEALQALRGVQLTVAGTTVAELGDLTRLENPDSS